MTRPITSEMLYNKLGWSYKSEVERRDCSLVKTDNLVQQLSNIVRLLANEEKWGILIRGVVGNGKTTMVNAIRRVINTLIENHYFGNSEIYAWDWMYLVDAEDMVNDYIRNREQFERYKTCSWLVIYDLGIEPAKVALYGTDFYPFRELFNYRYKHRLPTIITSNFKERELKEIYIDERFADRFNEMFCATTFRDTSFRK